MVVEEAPQEGVMVVVVVVVVGMEDEGNSLMVAFWLEIFLWIAGQDLATFFQLPYCFVQFRFQFYYSNLIFCFLSLHFKNLASGCICTFRPEELRAPFERFGLVRDVYIPKDYYTG